MKDLIRNYRMNINRKMSVDSDNESTPLASSANSTGSFGAMQCMFPDSDTTAGESDIDKPREISPVTPKSFTRKPFCYPGGHFENTNFAVFTNDDNIYDRYPYFTKKPSSISLTDSIKKDGQSITSVIEKPTTQSSLITIFSIWNTMMGTSLLTMAWGIQHAGLFPGILSIILVAGVTLYTTYLVLKVNESHGLGDNDEVAHLCKQLLGRWAEIIAKIFSMIVLIGANIVYWVLMSNFLYNTVVFLHDYFTDTSDETQPNNSILCPREEITFSLNNSNITEIIPVQKTHFEEIWDLNSTVPLFLGIIMFPLLNFKHVTFFTKFNSLGTLSVLYLMIFVFVKGVTWGINISDWTDEFYWRPNITALTGILAMSYFIHNIIICLMKSNKHPRNNGRDLSIAFALVTFTYIFIGTIFYITFPLAKSCIEDNILNNFTKYDTLTIVARLLLLFQLVTVFPLIAFMLRSEILQNLKIMFSSCKYTGEFSYFKVIVLNLSVIAICVIFACFLPRIGTLIRYTGALSGLIHIFTLPCLLKMASLQKEGKLTVAKVLMYVFIIIFVYEYIFCVNSLHKTFRGMDSKTSVYVERPLYQQEELHVASRYEKPDNNGLRKVINCAKSFEFASFIKGIFPILQWLPEYNCKTDLLPDIIAGITVAIMHIPQGMAYGLLGNLDPVVGIYMAFFPVLIYTLLGTSRHVSMGTFAVVCLMTGKAVAQYSTEDSDGHILNGINNETSIEPIVHYTKYEVAMAVTFTVALFHLLMYVCRLGILCTLLSTTLVNAFTTGSAVHVIISQSKDLFGLIVPKRKGYLKNGYAIYDALLALPNANTAAVTVSVIAVTIMVVNNELLKPWVSKRSKIPIPIELIAVCMGTLFSYLLDLSGQYGVTLVGNIPTGLPEPVVPTFSLIKIVAFDAFSIAIVSYAVTMSMALIFAQKLSYEVNSNQECLALGLSNIFGSFFSCMPITASLSRSFIQQVVGGVTQIASVVSCLILLVVMLWIGPAFQFLPRCILASIIVVALKGLFVQAKDLVKFWQLSKLDALVWLVTFGCVVLLDIDVGLLAGIMTSVLVICIQSFKPNTSLLGVVPNTEIYLDMKRYKGAEEIDGIKIFHYVGGLNFASRSMFKSELIRRVSIDPRKILLQRKKNATMSKTPIPDESSLLVQVIIIDLSAVNYIDPSGVEQLGLVQNEFEQLEISTYLASASGPVYESIQKCDSYTNKRSTFTIFPTIHDAVLYAKETLVLSDVVGLARRVERIEELSNELLDQPAKLYPLKCDISKEEDIVEAFEWIKSNVGSVSIMINNAGLTRPTTLIDGDVQEWKTIFDVNVIGLCICTREAIKSMQENEIDGQIIHINSIVGHYVTASPEPILNVYPASKFAVTALTETLRQDLRHAGSKIKITSISPGVVETEFQDGFPDENIKEAVKGIPHLVPEDLADAVHYVLTTPPHVQIAELTIRPIHIQDVYI
ncbi:prestin [Carabus blaptoides fortunei]